jgi:hypothetical protein
MSTFLVLSTIARLAVLTPTHREDAIAGRLEGIVRDTSGQPIPSAQVRVS